MRFGTKAETLERLAPLVKTALVLPVFRFLVREWKSDRAGVVRKIQREKWGVGAVIVRSSASSEDTEAASAAGRYASVLNVSGTEELIKAIDVVVASYGRGSGRDEVLVQPMLGRVTMSGVAFSRDPSTGGEYYVVNYDDKTNSTSSVTSGTSSDLKTLYIYKHGADVHAPRHIAGVLDLMKELESIFGRDALDIEFAVGEDSVLYLLQVRPLVNVRKSELPKGDVHNALVMLEDKIHVLNQPHPHLFGEYTILGVMPDWNPAEMIGIRPKPLAMSLYRELVTDSIWAHQREAYGYRDVRGFPLLIDLAGVPYIDVRVDFNSFIPATLHAKIAAKLTQYYLDKLREHPESHDKVEFDILFTCYTFNIEESISTLGKHGFSMKERREILESLRKLTRTIIDEKGGIWKKDREKIVELERRQATVSSSPLDPITKIFWLLEDCKWYGTLPFAGLARSAFIATQMMRTLVASHIVSADEYALFMQSLDLISSRIGRDFDDLSKEEFLKRYGHLRPGTYDILSPRYDEASELYFTWGSKKSVHKATGGKKFLLSKEKSAKINKYLKEHKLDQDARGLFYFIKNAIELREYSKFVFTRSVSEVLRLIRDLGEQHGFSPEECSYLDIACLKNLYAASGHCEEELRECIERGRRRHALARSVVLPPILFDPSEVRMFALMESQPNFITLKSASGPVVSVRHEKDLLKNSILFIESADPGYDWVFHHGIAGLVTMYGGANSHMAIRAAELGLPSVIGAGEVLYTKWSGARYVEVDCANKQLRILES